MKSTSISVTFKSDRVNNELVPFTGKWNSPIIVKVTNISQITNGPIIYTGLNVDQSKTQRPLSEPKPKSKLT